MTVDHYIKSQVVPAEVLHTVVVDSIHTAMRVASMYMGPEKALDCCREVLEQMSEYIAEYDAKAEMENVRQAGESVKQ